MTKNVKFNLEYGFTVEILDTEEVDCMVEALIDGFVYEGTDEPDDHSDIYFNVVEAKVCIGYKETDTTHLFTSLPDVERSLKSAGRWEDFESLVTEEIAEIVSRDYYDERD